MTHRPTIRLVRLLGVATTLALVASTCGAGDDSDQASNDPAAAAAAALDEEARRPGSGPASDLVASDSDPPPIQTAPTDDDSITTGRIPGTLINQYMLTIDQCFDRFEDLVSGRTVPITTLIPCSRPHQFQIFGRLDYPAPHPSLHPGDAVMEDFALQSCYLLFENWVGAPYEISRLDIGVIAPDKTDFESEEGPYRGIHCWVRRVDGEALVGTARGSEL